MDCLFCKIINNEIPSYTVYEDEYVKCFLDINPTHNGETLVVPKKHFKDIYDIDEEYNLKVHAGVIKVMNILEDKFKAIGFQIIENQGNMQEIKHLHIHVVPHYNKKEEKLSVEEIYNMLIK
jgi:histidine triad (HIT) family protein